MHDKLTLRVSLQSHYSTKEHSCDVRGGCHVPDISEEEINSALNYTTRNLD